MKRKSVAAILSALVFPGAGQYYLHRRKRALWFLGPAAIAGLLYLNFQIDQASALADQVLGGTIPLDPAAIEARIAAQPTPFGVTLAGVVFIACWIGSIVEVFIDKGGDAGG